MRRFLNVFLGATISSLGIAMVINSCLGVFAITSCNMALSLNFNIPFSVASMIVELIMIAYASYKGEGLGVSAIVNATYSSIMIDVFKYILPQSKLFCIGLLLLPVGWMIMGKAGLGDTGSNLMMNAILKSTGKSVRTVRTIQELLLLAIGFIGARNYVTWFSIVITILIGPITQFIYNLFKYEPTKVVHKYLIQFNRVKNKELNRI